MPRPIPPLPPVTTATRPVRSKSVIIDLPNQRNRNVTRSDPGDLRPMMALLKALWKLRPPGEPEPPGARLVRRWREKRLLARLEQGWPGGFTLHRTGDLVYVPRPLDARGRHALLHPPRAHPAVLACLHSGFGCDRRRRQPRRMDRPIRPLGRCRGAGASRSSRRRRAPLPSKQRSPPTRCARPRSSAARSAITTARRGVAVPVVTSARTDTGTARIGPASVGYKGLRVPLRRLESLAAELRPRSARSDQNRC